MTTIPSILGPNERRSRRMIFLVGMIATRWTQVEIATQQLLANLARVDEQLGLAIATHIPDRTAIEIILAMSRQYGNLGALGGCIETYAKMHNNCRENRNLFVHGNHVISEVGLEPTIHVIQRHTARGRIKVENLEITYQMAVDLAKEIAVTANFGNEIVSVLIAVQDEKPRPPMHGPPKVPMKLLETLRRVPSDEILQPRPDGRKWISLEKD